MSKIDAIRDLITSDLGWVGDRSLLTEDYQLLENDVIDSLAIFQIVSFIEAEFGIEIEVELLTPDNFETLGAIGRLIEQ